LTACAASDYILSYQIEKQDFGGGAIQVMGTVVPTRFVGLVGVVLLLSASVLADDSRVYDEARVKAEFVERFCRFVDWPESAFASPDAPFVVAVLGKATVTPHLAEVARLRTVKGRRLEVRRLDRPDQVPTGHVVWISADAIDQLDAVLDRSHGNPILTVADTPGAAERGVLINLRRDGPYVRFDINLAEVQASGLRFSSKLLRLGTLVGPDVEGPR